MPPPTATVERTLAQARDAGKVALTRYPQLYNAARRPYALARFLLRRPHDSDYALFGLFPNRPGIFLDVGANAGQSAFSFRIYNRGTPILSIEPNPYHTADLRFTGRVVRRHSFEICAAGDSSGTLDLHIPLYRGVPLTTEASLYAEEVTESKSLRARLGDRMDSDGFEIDRCTVPVRALDELDVRAGYVKLDVQGAELAALRGMSATIERDRPILLVETPEPAVLELLSELGYTPYEYDPRAHRIGPRTGTRVNVLFLPEGEQPPS